MSLSKQDLVDLDALIDNAVLQCLFLMCAFAVIIIGIVMIASFWSIDATDPAQFLPFTVCLSLCGLIVVLLFFVGLVYAQTRERVVGAIGRVKEARESLKIKDWEG